VKRRAPPTSGDARSLRARGQNHETGRRAESVVADYLFASGFTVLARNVRVGKL
jgi:hypothetical protein